MTVEIRTAKVGAANRQEEKEEPSNATKNPSHTNTVMEVQQGHIGDLQKLKLDMK